MNRRSWRILLLWQCLSLLLTGTGTFSQLLADKLRFLLDFIMIGWDGVEWREVKRSEVKRSEVKWREVKWSEVEWNGVEFIGLNWIGLLRCTLVNLFNHPSQRCQCPSISKPIQLHSVKFLLCLHLVEESKAFHISNRFNLVIFVFCPLLVTHTNTSTTNILHPSCLTQWWSSWCYWRQRQ